eukprot:NODE_253_length_2203_cov_70.795279_g247_i0.p1 GENE.NODE_253_length_2203_cov_70.795279_g247_i0~~NODE_253_length_2203_cov_70.795279_g247_i0.p1  ORF type:complete len:672 (+),score=85.92 NODE_253_length_2203_cov_70.795279_g247_i0:63-2018(+)
MMKNLVDMAFGALAYMLFGYSLAWGPDGNSFVGWGRFTLWNADPTEYSWWLWHWCFSATAATILSGALAERIAFRSYAALSFVMSAFIQPFPARWVWHPNGWLHELGFVDLAGCGAVHLVGGTFALVGTTMLGPRRHRFPRSEVPEEDVPHIQRATKALSSPTTALFGCFFLWLGWYGFNTGSPGGLTKGRYLQSGLVGVNTSVGPGGGIVASFVMSQWLNGGGFSIEYCITGILGGLVSITAAPHVFQPVLGALVGFFGAAMAILASHGLERLRIDDPVGAVPVHFVCGLWGLFTAGCIQHDFSWKVFGVQFLGMLAIVAWSAVLAGTLFAVLLRLGMLRVSKMEEEAGLDQAEHCIIPYCHTNHADDETVRFVVLPWSAARGDAHGTIEDMQHAMKRLLRAERALSCARVPHSESKESHARAQSATPTSQTRSRSVTPVPKEAAGGPHPTPTLAPRVPVDLDSRDPYHAASMLASPRRMNGLHTEDDPNISTISQSTPSKTQRTGDSTELKPIAVSAVDGHPARQTKGAYTFPHQRDAGLAEASASESDDTDEVPVGRPVVQYAQRGIMGVAPSYTIVRHHPHPAVTAVPPSGRSPYATNGTGSSGTWHTEWHDGSSYTTRAAPTTATRVRWAPTPAGPPVWDGDLEFA